MSAAGFDPDKSHEALERAAHERAVREFFAKAEAADPEKFAEVRERHVVLTERQLYLRRLREGYIYTSGDEEASSGKAKEELSGELRFVPGVYVSQKPDRRLREFRPSRPGPPRPVVIRPRSKRRQAIAYLKARPSGRVNSRVVYDEAPASEVTLEELKGLENAMAGWAREYLTTGQEWSDQMAADHAEISRDRLRLMMTVIRETTEADYQAVLAVFDNIIETRAKPRMLAYGQEHGVPGFEASARP